MFDFIHHFVRIDAPFQKQIIPDRIISRVHNFVGISIIQRGINLLAIPPLKSNILAIPPEQRKCSLISTVTGQTVPII